MSQILTETIHAVRASRGGFCKFLSPNDSGATHAHQAGVLISKACADLMFDVPLCNKGIMDRWVDIEWINLAKTTHSRFVYYSSKKELRITNFGRGFPYFKPDQTGALFILIKRSSDNYATAVLEEEEDIERFLSEFSMSPTETNNYIPFEEIVPAAITEDEYIEFIVQRYFDRGNSFFPSSAEMSEFGRDLSAHTRGNGISATKKPDETLLAWAKDEFSVYRAFESIEFDSLRERLQTAKSQDELMYQINSMANRRKSRAGKSLENQLAAIFIANNLLFTPQATTEGRKKPDFIFPSEAAYHNPNYPTNGLISLAAKTTCRDRWRQILNEADRTPVKYLCTLQQGISLAQLEEMQAEGVKLVVPKDYIKYYPSEMRPSIMTIKDFIALVTDIENNHRHLFI